MYNNYILNTTARCSTPVLQLAHMMKLRTNVKEEIT
jgi:hypothetical protein